MRIFRLVAVALVVTTLTVTILDANALGSHQAQPPVSETTSLLPAYCVFGSSQAPDSTETWTNISTSSGRHSSRLLALQLTSAAAGHAIPYGLVTDASLPIFSSLAFDAQGNSIGDNRGGVTVIVANNDGFIDQGVQPISALQAAATSTTPAGFKHFIATPHNIGNDFDNTATFVLARIGIQSGESKESLTIVNVNLNGSSTAATAVGDTI